MKIVVVAVVLAAGCVGGSEHEDAVAGEGLAGDGVDDGGGKEDRPGMTDRVCADGATTMGVDVSYYQGVIDWPRAKQAGVQFAFIRLSDGWFRDPKFDANWGGAKAAGVIRGAYQYFRPAQSATEQADMMIDAIGVYTPGDLPPVIDVETTGGLSSATVAARVKTWVDRVEAALGVRPIVYTGSYFWRDQVGGANMLASSLWIAQYTTQCPYLPLPWRTWTFWQHTDRGTVAGIRGRVDMDKFNGSIEELRAFAMR